MKQFFTNIKLATLSVSLLFAYSASAKTFTAKASGKWNDVSIWENEKPNNLISAGDEVIIQGHVLMSDDIAINGSLIIDKNASFITNRSVAISNNGQLVNNGSVNAKRIINEGKIENFGSLETMSELQNTGNFNNDQNVVVGTTMINQGGSLSGNNGSYFANTNVVSSHGATYSDNINVFVGGGENTNSLVENEFNVELLSQGNNVTLTVQNISDKKVLNYEVLKSTDGVSFNKVEYNHNTKNDLLIIHDNEIAESSIHFKVNVITTSGNITLPTASIGLGNSNTSMR